MANVTNDPVSGRALNPWVLDTASPTPVTREYLRVASIRWTGASSAAHSVVLKDTDGNVLWEATSTAADYTEESTPSLNLPAGQWKGLVVDTLGSGKLYLTLE